MIDFPEVTHIHKRLPKEAFYKYLPKSAKLKEKFISDIDKIFVEWDLTQRSLHLEKSSDKNEILILLIELKKQNYETKIIEAIEKQNSHKLVFILSFEKYRQLALYYHGKLYRTEWMQADDINLSANGSSINAIWENLIVQIALSDETGEIKSLSIDARLERQEKINILTKLIEKTEAAVWKERQPKKKFELHEKVQGYKKELEKKKNG